MEMCKKKKNVYTKGFTLVETLVAVTILMTAIVGPLVIAYQGVSIGVDSRDRLIASYLAQDALEYVRYHIVTESNGGATSTDVMSGLESCNCAVGKCQIDTKSGTIAGCGASCADLLWNEDKHYYGHGGGGDTWMPTLFNREVKIFWDNVWIVCRLCTIARQFLLTLIPFSICFEDK